MRERETLCQPNEGMQIYMAVRNTSKIPGALAEVGVYQGGTAKIICEAKGERELYLFDTYEGLPAPSANDHAVHYQGQFRASLDGVKEHLRAYSGVHFVKGIFPDSGGVVKDIRFSFVHLDVDLYESTLGSLEFFYPRLYPGGIILSHDYSSLPGVRKAFDEFFSDKPEPIIELSGYQCLVVKI